MLRELPFFVRQTFTTRKERSCTTRLGLILRGFRSTWVSELVDEGCVYVCMYVLLPRVGSARGSCEIMDCVPGCSLLLFFRRGTESKDGPTSTLTLPSDFDVKNPGTFTLNPAPAPPPPPPFFFLCWVRAGCMARVTISLSLFAFAWPHSTLWLFGSGVPSGVFRCTEQRAVFGRSKEKKSTLVLEKYDLVDPWNVADD